MSTRLVICADDFGRRAAINEAVFSLAHRGKLTAASVMVDEPFAAGAASDLLAIPGFEIGLHLTLTDAIAQSELGMPEGAVLPSIDRLTFDAFCRRLAPIDTEIARQFERFKRLFHRLPDFVDAHQHAHLLPGIREAVLDAAARESRSIWVRSCEDSFQAIALRGGDRLRAWRSAWLSRGIKRDAALRGLTTNDSFAGLYDFRTAGQYSKRFPAFLRRATSPNHLVIVHPAIEAERGDEIGPARVDEFRYLLHAPIEQLAAREGLVIGPFQ